MKQAGAAGWYQVIIFKTQYNRSRSKWVVSPPGPAVHPSPPHSPLPTDKNSPLPNFAFAENVENKPEKLGTICKIVWLWKVSVDVGSDEKTTKSRDKAELLFWASQSVHYALILWKFLLMLWTVVNLYPNINQKWIWAAGDLQIFLSEIIGLQENGGCGENLDWISNFHFY